VAVDSDRWFLKLELELSTGRSLRVQLTRDETAELSKRFFVQEDPADDVGLVRAAVSTLLMRLESEKGELILPDGDGRTWLLPASSIVAIALEHRLDTVGRHAAIEIGFRGPVGSG
jgi:hypothetical protein